MIENSCMGGRLPYGSVYKSNGPVFKSTVQKGSRRGCEFQKVWRILLRARWGSIRTGGSESCIGSDLLCVGF